MAFSKPLEEDEYEELMAEEAAMKIIAEQLIGRIDTPSCFKRKRTIKDYENAFWESTWGKLILNPNVENPKSIEGKRFRRRFRLPFPMFQYLVELCMRHNIFDLKNKSPIPIQLKILACLRILARDNCADDINELSFELLGESTVHNIFKTFVTNMAARVYPKLVKLAKGNQLQRVLSEFAKIGLPGCVGSMDCTRVKWTMCPARMRWLHTGKEGFPTAVFLVIVDHNKRVQYVSCAYKGSCNDVQICQNDPICLAVMNGALEDIEYELYNEFGEKYKCKGGYILVDGGFVNSIVFIEPDKFRVNRDAVLYSEWLESVRKDVECFFGILKKRWWWFRNGICYHDIDILEGAFKTVCALNNMILLFDQSSGKFDTEWETVDWSSLDPDAADLVDMNEPVRPIQPVECELSATGDTEDDYAPSFTRFTVKTPKPILKQALQKSFLVQWIKQKLQWPKNIEDTQRSNMPMIRATVEMKRALYRSPSTIVTKNGRSLNYGLFSKLAYRSNEIIAHFRGTLRTKDAWMRMCEVEPPRRAYGIISSENGVVLDCYDNYNAGLCLASASNSPVECVYIGTRKAAVANCRLVIPTVKKGQRKIFYLRAGVKDPEDDVISDRFYITPDTELLWDYGDSYVNYLD